MLYRKWVKNFGQVDVFIIYSCKGFSTRRKSTDFKIWSLIHWIVFYFMQLMDLVITSGSLAQGTWHKTGSGRKCIEISEKSFENRLASFAITGVSFLDYCPILVRNDYCRSNGETDFSRDFRQVKAVFFCARVNGAEHTGCVALLASHTDTQQHKLGLIGHPLSRPCCDTANEFMKQSRLFTQRAHCFNSHRYEAERRRQASIFCPLPFPSFVWSGSTNRHVEMTRCQRVRAC